MLSVNFNRVSVLDQDLQFQPQNHFSHKLTILFEFVSYPNIFHLTFQFYLLIVIDNLSYALPQHVLLDRILLQQLNTFKCYTLICLLSIH